MSNKLEEFVKENKKAFEEKGPSNQLWDRIAKELDEKKEQPVKKIKLYRWMSIAAVLVVSMGIYFTVKDPKADNIAIADVNPVFAAREVQFSSLIEEKKDSLQNYSDDNPELYSKFTADLSKLDADYETLKKQLQTSPNKEAIVRAMMKNLEIRSNILSQQINIINQVNQYKKENII
jgi:hypothetical protein